MRRKLRSCGPKIRQLRFMQWGVAPVLVDRNTGRKHWDRRYSTVLQRRLPLDSHLAHSRENAGWKRFMPSSLHSSIVCKWYKRSAFHHNLMLIVPRAIKLRELRHHRRRLLIVRGPREHRSRAGWGQQSETGRGERWLGGLRELSRLRHKE